MSGSKRYYWLKLNENFFEDDTIQWLEEQENGKDYVIFYLKLCLKSLDGEGKLIRYVGENLIPYDIKALSRLTSTPLDTVAVAMKTFLDIGLIERLDTGEIFMKQIDEMIGTETQYAVQKRRQRALNSKQYELSGQCPDNVLECPPEIEIELELDIDTDGGSVILTKEQEDYLNILKKIKHYPFDINKDLEYLEELEERYPTLDMVEAIQDFSDYKIDQPFKENSNHRSQLSNSFKNYVKWERCLKKDKKSNHSPREERNFV